MRKGTNNGASRVPEAEIDAASLEGQSRGLLKLSSTVS
jgi:hypothetical protein